MTSSVFRPLLWACLACACSSPRPAPSAAPAAAPAEPTAEPTTMTAPFTLDLRGPASVQPGQTITLALSVHRVLPGAAPLTVRLHVPAEVRVVRGPLEDKVTDGPDVVRQWELVVDRVPSQDVEVEVSLEEEGVRAHGRKRYTFGRPETPVKRPARGTDVDGTGGAVPLD